MPTTTLPAVLADGAARDPDGLAVLAPDRPPTTYAELAILTADIATAVAAAGAGRTDRVALVTANGPEAAAAFLGIASAAAVAPLNPTYRRDELAFALEDLRASMVVVQDGLDTPVGDVAARLGLPVLRMSAEPGGTAGRVRLDPGPGSGGPSAPISTAAPDDVALFLHTSGTTARPKLVPLTHGRLIASARTIAATLALTPADRCLNVMPLFHIHGLVGALLATLVSGGSIVTAPGFLATEFYGWLEAFEPTWYTAVPTIHQAVLARADPHRDVIARRPLRFIRSSSASLPAATLEGLEATFSTPVIEAYGMTEASHQMASNPVPPGIRKTGSVGRASGIEIAILDAGGAVLGPEALGEVGIRGATVFAGYDANPEANATAFVDGWFRTGDQGVLDADGYLFLRSRLKELINRGGEKIAPVEVEEALLAIPGVAQAVVFAMPDARLGEDVAAAVVPADRARLAEHDLQAILADRLAAFKVPRTILVVEEIPKGPTGKVQRIGLAARLGLGDGVGPPARPPATRDAATAVRPRTPMEHDLAAIWADVLGHERVGVTDDFFELGGDSMLAAIVITRIGDRFGSVDLPLATFLWAPTVERYARGLESGTWTAPGSSLLPIQPEGRRPPFFFVNVDDGVIGPAALRRTLGPDQPLYGLRAVTGDAESTMAPTVDAIVDAFLEEIRSVRPSGPYLLGGFCSAGPIALEMARRLRESGEAVPVLALVDPRMDRRHGLSRVVQDPWYYVRRVPRHLRSGQLWRAVKAVGHDLVSRGPEPAPDGPLDRREFLDALYRSRRAYPQEPYEGPVSVLHSRQYEVPRSFWEGLAGDLTWEPLPVDHDTIFQGDDGEVLATSLGSTLRAAEAP